MIVVIGVLSAMMMLSSTEAVSSARATSIINNLKNWKTAALEWYADNIDRVDIATGKVKDSSGEYKYFAEVVHAKDLLPYLGSGLKEDGNDVKDSSGGIYKTDYYQNRDWTITYQLASDKDNPSLLKKIESRAQSIGLGNYMQSRSFPYKVKWNGNTPTNSYKFEIIVVDFSNK